MGDYKKAILVGNGFTSFLISDYGNDNMKNKLLHENSEDYNYINSLFSDFRLPNITKGNIFDMSDEVKGIIVPKLVKSGFTDCSRVYERYFENYGLIYEIAKSEICSIENLLKVVNMFSLTGRFDNATEEQIILTANKIYYNNGKYGLEDTILKDYSKARKALSIFDYVFTTNYDLILDDICEWQDKVFHLHGGFNIEHPNLKVYKRLNYEEACIIWGIDGDDKYNKLSPGWDFNNINFNAIRLDQSLLADYFDYLRDFDYEEIHIFGYSGENDQHINNRVTENEAVQRIYFYCDPNSEIQSDGFKRIKREMFFGTQAEIIFEPWTKIWEKIM